MRRELYTPFIQICGLAKEISGMPELADDQIAKIFEHVSNSDMETTIRTMRYAYHMITQEAT